MKHMTKWVAGVTGMALLIGTGAASAQNYGTESQSSPSENQNGSWGSQGNQSSSSQYESGQQSQNQFSPRVSRSEAEQSAEAEVPGGTIQSGGLERENGKLLWSFDVSTPGSQNITEVNVDANNGNIVSVNQESSSQEQNEQSYAQQENKGQQSSQQQSWGNQQPSQSSQWSRQRQNSQNQGYFGTTSESGQSSQFCDAKQLLGEQVSNQQGETLGHIKDILFNTHNGEVFAVIGVASSQNALVPVQALNITGEPNSPEVTLNMSKQALRNGPLVQNNRWAQALNNRQFTRRLYNRYNLQVQPGSEVGVVIVQPLPQGGSGSGYLGGSSSGTGSTANQQSPGFYPKQGSGAYQQQQPSQPEQQP